MDLPRQIRVTEYPHIVLTAVLEPPTSISSIALGLVIDRVVICLSLPLTLHGLNLVNYAAPIISFNARLFMGCNQQWPQEPGQTRKEDETDASDRGKYTSFGRLQALTMFLFLLPRISEISRNDRVWLKISPSISPPRISAFKSLVMLIEAVHLRMTIWLHLFKAAYRPEWNSNDVLNVVQSKHFCPLGKH